LSNAILDLDNELGAIDPVDRKLFEARVWVIVGTIGTPVAFPITWFDGIWPADGAITC